MQVDGKMARLRAISRNASPEYAPKHERPFSVNFGYRGPLAEDMATFTKK